MSRRPNYLSQGLVVALIALCAIAIIAYVNRPSKKTEPQASAPTTSPAVVASEPAPPKESIFTTETPTSLANNDESKASPGPAALQAPPPATRPVAQSWEKLVPDESAAPKLVALANVSTQDPQQQIEAGDILGARAALNAQFLSNKNLQTRSKLAELNRTIVFSTRRFADDPFGGTYQVQNGDSLQKIAKAHNVTWELLGRMNDISDPRKLRAGRAIKIINGPFHAVVNKSRFEMDIWLGEPGSAESMYITTFRVGLGKDSSTPTGTWVVTQGGKQKNPKFWGAGDLPPMEADDPKNPLGEFWLGLTGIAGAAEGRESYGIHGTIDPDSIGRQMSLGCIRLASQDIELVYELLVDGKSKVYVSD